MEGRNLYEVRRRMGEELAREHPAETDLVMPVPDTGAPAAAGYAEISGIPFREGLIRNRYTGRTFIQPSQTMRHRGVTMKLNPLREVVRGKRLTVVDDSIVRGTTTKQIVSLLRRAGAEEVHVRISAPPIYHPCFYGIDTQVETELIAATHSTEEIREFIGADSLGYLSIRGVLAALDLPYDRFCFACFDGNYPEPVPYDSASRKFVLEEGTITFTGPPPPDPRFDVTATFKNPRYRVTAHIGGSATKPTLALSSDPPLEQADILAVLLFGKPARELGKGESAALQQQALSLAAGYVMPELRTSVMDTLGLDELDVQMPQGTTQPGRVAVGRYVVGDVFVSLAQEFGTRIAQVVGVEYGITRDISIKGSTSTRGDSAVDLFWHRRY